MASQSNCPAAPGLNCCRQSAGEGRCLGIPIPYHPTPPHPTPPHSIPSHPIPSRTTPPHPPLHPDRFCPPQLLLPRLIQLRDDLLCFLASVALAGGSRPTPRAAELPTPQALPSTPQHSTGPSFRLVSMSRGSISPTSFHHPHLQAARHEDQTLHPLAASPLLHHAEPGAPIPHQEHPSHRAKAAVAPRGGQQHWVDPTTPNPLPPSSPERWAALGLYAPQERARASLPISIIHNGLPGHTKPPPRASVHEC